MGDDEGNANDSNDTASTVANPYIKNNPSVSYADVRAKKIAAASRGKSSNSTSSKGSNKTKRKRRQTTQQVRAQVEKSLNTKARNKAIKEAAEAEAEKKKKEEEQPFFRKYTTNTNKTNGTDNNTNESTNNNGTDTNTSTTNNNTNAGFIGPLPENNLPYDIEDKDDGDEEGDKDEEVVVDNPPLKTKTPYDIIL